MLVEVDATVSDDTKHLIRDLKRSQRAGKIRAFALIAPLLVFLVLVFIGPVANLLTRSVVDSGVSEALPATIAALADWNPSNAEPIPDAAFVALVADLKSGGATQIVARAGTRLNYGLPGMRALLMRTRTAVQGTSPSADARHVLAGISPKWEEVATWSVIRQAGGPLTDFYLLSSLDLRRDPQDHVRLVDVSDRVFVPTIMRTFEISLVVTVLAFLFGFPFAYLTASVSDRVARLLIFMVLLPFWTAVLVRTLSWMVLLQRNGIVNQALMDFGLIDQPLELLFNRFAVYVSLLHIFVPYMVLPLYSAMKSVPQSHMRAAASLGAPPWIAFRRVYLPQIGPGVAAGALLVFIQCLGVFVIPAILGGPNDQGIPYMIVFYVNRSLNWGLAAALSVILLVAVYLFYWLFTKLAGTTKLSVG